MLDFIDYWKSKTFLQVFTIYLRYLIGGAFVLAAIGMGKLDGNSNLLNSMAQPIQNLQPIQQFFRVMTESGLYWKFIGWSQIIAGVLLITQRYAKTGALIFFGMILNIFIITLSYDFKGTPVITGLMLLASIYLLLWDVRSLQFLFMEEGQLTRLPLQIMDRRYWTVLGLIMIFSIVIVMMLKRNLFLQLIIPFAEGLAGFIYFFTIHRKKRSTPQSV